MDSLLSYFKNRSILAKTFLPFFLATVAIVTLIILWTSQVLRKDVEYRLIETLRYHQTTITNEIKDIELRLRFYGQFMADINRLSEQFADTKLGRSIMVYAINFMRANNMYPYIPKTSSNEENYSRLIKKGLMGLRSTSLIEHNNHNKLSLSIDSVNPVETSAGIEEAVIISYPLNHSCDNKSPLIRYMRHRACPE